MAASSTPFVIVEPLGASSSSTESETDGRMVRFDTECVLIPDPSSSSRRGPRVITKSYSLPLWKRRPAAGPSAGASDSESIDDPSTAPFLSSSPEETHVVLRVPIPSFVRRPSRSPGPSRGAYSGRSLSSSPTIPLSPCLVRRPTTTPPSPSTAESPQRLFSPTSPTLRRPTLPIYHRRQDEQTVPLRACCPDCVPITDQCLREGSLWKEKFTRGARRLRSASLDSSTTSGSGISIGGPQKAAFVPGSFDAKMPSPTFAITVDEVDKRRRSQDNSSAAAVPVVVGGDLDVITDSPSLIPPPHLVPRKASPIAEENEDELFPLPSPRRSPTGSSSSSTRSSPRPSPRTSPGVSPKISPGPSPNTSSSCLHPNDAVVLAVALKAKTKSRSKESVSSEELLANSSGTAGISRKKENNGIIDTPPQSGASTPRARPSLTLPFPHLINIHLLEYIISNTQVTYHSNINITSYTYPISILSLLFILTEILTTVVVGFFRTKGIFITASDTFGRVEE
ncbi:hypothetical protein AN958_07090 [Leucoagaricus sp. SymC.cos]|nr:hypothetical protein AN958_07090 [Leucoagaricus sp. SymC.cos]